MFNFAQCELCEKKTTSLKYWFGSMICPKCYDLQRSNPQTILVSNLQDWLRRNTNSCVCKHLSGYAYL